MAGIRGRSGPPGKNAFRHGLAGLAQRRADGVLNPAEQSIREDILSGLLADKGNAVRDGCTATDNHAREFATAAAKHRKTSYESEET